MSGEKIPIHFVSTFAEAKALVDRESRFWVSNCGCREGRGGCSRSRMDLCLMFADVGSSGSDKREVPREFVDGILREAVEKRLVSRPFRNDARDAVEGICFCCDDCCGYFLDPEETCDPGREIEATRLEACTHCGVCADVCHFGARRMDAGELRIDRARCYGCGLCAGVWTEDCIRMVARG